jgi:molybdopterin-guanine dinucleotide biosynthesis protein A
MGRDKALVEIGGRPMLALVIERIRPLFDDIFIAGGDESLYGAFGIPVHRDVNPGCGSLGGIYTALVKAAHPLVFCVACDMPFVDPGLVTFLLGEMERGSFQAVIPTVDGEAEPLCAVYSRNSLPVVERDLDTGVRRIKSTLASLKVRAVDADEMRPFDPELRTFFNINTPEDLKRASEMGSALDS